MRLDFVQDIIDIIRGKIFALHPIVDKYECYERVKNYHTLALGSSHMEKGYIPSVGEINMGSTSQDLYYSYNLYKLFNNQNLKRVFITFSVFSSGDFLIKSRSGMGRMCIIFKLLYGIPYQLEEYAAKNKFKYWEKYYNSQIKRYRKKIKLPDEYRGEFIRDDIKDIPKDITKIKQRALRHYKIHCKEEKNIEYLIKLLEDTKKNSQELYIILPPATSIYKSPLPASSVIFSDLYEICKDYSHAKIINLYDSDKFTDEDFRDGDHLNLNGRKKFTNLLHEYIKISSK